MNADCKIVGDERLPALTGYMRDGHRRVDLVLVPGGDGGESEQVVVAFLKAAIDAGLHLELEFGVMKQHFDLTFVKVHAPDSLVEEYGRHYSLHKPLKASHTELMRPTHFLLELACRCLRLPYEREWLHLMRAQYPGPAGYCTLERSRLVHRILLGLRFGRHQNYYGLHRLLTAGIIRAAFPLHDGPYFYVPDQIRSRMNARQVLFLNWVGYENLLKPQPLHVVREYLGERVGFLFSFLEYYNRFLLAIGLLGIVAWILGCYDPSDHLILWSIYKKYNYTFSKWVKTNASWSVTRRHYVDLPVCPKCGDTVACPLRNLTQYASEVEFKTSVDNVAAVVYSFLVSVCAILLHLNWRRRESYLAWLWEVDPEEAHTAVCAEHEPDYRPEVESCGDVIVRTLRLKMVFSRLVQFCVPLAVLCLYIFVALPTLVSMRYLLLRVCDDFDGRWGLFRPNDVVLVLVAMTNGALVILLEKVSGYISERVTAASNHIMEDSQERAIVTTLFGFDMLFNFGFLFYVTFLQGWLYSSPAAPSLPLGLWATNCGPLGCIDEVFIVFVVTHVSIAMFEESYQYMRSRVTPRGTDYLLRAWDVKHAPCWEREFTMQPLTEQFVLHIYRKMFIQICVSTMFVCVCPVAPLAVFVANLWTTRELCAEVLVRRRRPALLAGWSLGAWRQLLVVMPYIIAVCNALTVALNSSIFDYLVHRQHFPHLRYFVDFSMSFFNMSDIKLVPESDEGFNEFGGDLPDFCLFPGKYHRESDNKYELADAAWLVNWHQLAFFLLYTHLVAVIGFFLHVTISARARHVSDTLDMEDAILRQQETDVRADKHTDRRRSSKKIE